MQWPVVEFIHIGHVHGKENYRLVAAAAGLVMQADTMFIVCIIYH